MTTITFHEIQTGTSDVSGNSFKINSDLVPVGKLSSTLTVRIGFMNGSKLLSDKTASNYKPNNLNIGIDGNEHVLKGDQYAKVYAAMNKAGAII